MKKSRPLRSAERRRAHKAKVRAILNGPDSPEKDNLLYARALRIFMHPYAP